MTEAPAPKRVLLGIPSNGTLSIGTSQAIHHASDRDLDLGVVHAGSSLLAMNFNALWCTALNSSPRPDYFAMLHSDIVPAPGWIDTLIEDLESGPYDVVSAVVPIKDANGWTSTGLGRYRDCVETVLVGDREHRRITTKELQSLPAVFETKHVRELFESAMGFLTINTGCWIARFGAAPWVETFPGFNIEDRIVRKEDGSFEARVWPEDWKFSEGLASDSIPYAATQNVNLTHVGVNHFGSRQKWGKDHDSWGRMA